MPDEFVGTSTRRQTNILRLLQWLIGALLHLVHALILFPSSHMANSAFARQLTLRFYFSPAAATTSARWFWRETSTLAPHAQSLYFPEFAHAPDNGDHAEEAAKDADQWEAKVSLFDEILQIHAVKAGKEGAHTDTKGQYRKLKIQEHQGVAVGVQYGFDTINGVSLGIFM
jgi:hypothetical protein